MHKTQYSLRTDLNNGIIDIPAPAELNVQVRNLVMKTSKGKTLAAGEMIAEHPSKLGGAYHTPLSGKVVKVNYHNLTIKCDGGEEAVAPVDIASMGPGKELLRSLQDLGIGVAPLSGAEILVINGLNPEPGVSVAEQLLKGERELLEDGLKLVKKFIVPVRTVLALAEGAPYKLAGSETKTVKPKYPNSLDALVVKAVTGKEFPSNTKVISVMDLYNIGRIARTGLPMTHTVMTINGNNYRVPLGTPIRHIIDHLGMSVEPHDKVVLGGPFRGEAVYSLDEGVKKGDYGLFVVPAGSFPPVEDAACINCGECVLFCPGRIQANLIARYAEFERFEMAEKHGLNSCFECGLCAFNCVARKPLLQYIRFAKAQLKARGEKA
ncbi:4Fe-4S dicluster domain-containing protein [Desulfocurvibacter africanus]|uniref:4Fe-4S dicluster domain-containing protein n=1 Tax=Desulfocurvibacter africanus TaxID=873 RepID=UPI00040951F8|nr:4Fe-4S dicluster domain-containing protein [Desulfocurvibacter africanus]